MEVYAKCGSQETLRHFCCHRVTHYFASPHSTLEISMDSATWNLPWFSLWSDSRLFLDFVQGPQNYFLSYRRWCVISGFVSHITASTSSHTFLLLVNCEAKHFTDLKCHDEILVLFRQFRVQITKPLSLNHPFHLESVHIFSNFFMPPFGFLEFMISGAFLLTRRFFLFHFNTGMFLIFLF